MLAGDNGQLTGKLFVASLLSVGFAVLFSNLMGKNTASATSDILLAVLSGLLLAVSATIVIRFRGRGDHGMAYILFAGFSALWFLAEVSWLNFDMFARSPQFPQQDDLLYLGAYPLLFVFTIYYLKPFRLAVSRKMIALAGLATSVFLIPTLYSMHSLNPAASVPEILWGAIYPVADAAVLFPAVIGVSLFIKGKVGLFWSLTCIAIILNIAADSGFFFLDISKPSYSGNPVNLLYMWAYILFAFGAYSHVRIFSRPKMRSYGNVDDIR